MFHSNPASASACPGVGGVQEEFQREREDMLDTIRQLTRQLKLKDVIITNFVPPEESKKVGRSSKTA